MEDDGLVWMGTPDAAAYIGITQRTLYRIVDAGELPAYKLGRVIRLRRADLDAYLEAVKVQPGDLRHLFPERAADRERAKSTTTDHDRPAAPPVPLAQPRESPFGRPADGEFCPCGSGSVFGECHGGGS